MFSSYCRFVRLTPFILLASRSLPLSVLSSLSSYAEEDEEEVRGLKEDVKGRLGGRSPLSERIAINVAHPGVS
jgi:hypothetical protein